MFGDGGRNAVVTDRELYCFVAPSIEASVGMEEMWRTLRGIPGLDIIQVDNESRSFNVINPCLILVT